MERGMLSLVVGMLNISPLRLLVLIELYLLSMSDKVRTAFADTDCPLLVRLCRMM